MGKASVRKKKEVTEIQKAAIEDWKNRLYYVWIGDKVYRMLYDNAP